MMAGSRSEEWGGVQDVQPPNLLFATDPEAFMEYLVFDSSAKDTPPLIDFLLPFLFFSLSRQTCSGAGQGSRILHLLLQASRG